MGKERLDTLLVRRGLFDSRSAARAAIKAGGVEVEGDIVKKPAFSTRADAELVARPAHPYVSRGGVKLAHALQAFGVDPAGRQALDIGTSTGGFVDVLLKAGARHVTCVDVGRGQLHPSLIEDRRIRMLEGQDARTLTHDLIGAVPDLMVCDVSFIALEKLLPRALSLLHQRSDFVGLFKPQFQVGRPHVGKGGIVTDLAAADAAADRFGAWLSSQGWQLVAWTPSPILGGSGNQERLFHAVNT